MKKLKLKKPIKITILSLIVFLSFVFISSKFDKTQTVLKEEEEFIYVNGYIFDDYYPVSKENETILKPFNSDKVTIYKNFYEKEDSKEKQQNSIIYYDGIYMQNSGVDYNADEQFDVLSALSGSVTNITDDALLGKTIEITSKDKITIMYQSLGDVLVKKGDTIMQGQTIAKSGTSSINSEIKNGLHIEIYKNGTVVNPENYIGKTIDSLN